jgi:hypothetical protein
MSAQDTWYSKKEWAKLTPAQRKGVILKREQRQKGTGGGTANKDPKAGGKGYKRMKRKLAKLTRKVAAMEVNGEEKSDSGTDSEDEPATKKSKKTKTNNRNHPATNRGARRS